MSPNTAELPPTPGLWGQDSLSNSSTSTGDHQRLSHVHHESPWLLHVWVSFYHFQRAVLTAMSVAWGTTQRGHGTTHHFMTCVVSEQTLGGSEQRGKALHKRDSRETSQALRQPSRMWSCVFRELLPLQRVQQGPAYLAPLPWCLSDLSRPARRGPCSTSPTGLHLHPWHLLLKPQRLAGLLKPDCWAYPVSSDPVGLRWGLGTLPLTFQGGCCRYWTRCVLSSSALNISG